MWRVFRIRACKPILFLVFFFLYFFHFVVFYFPLSIVRTDLEREREREKKNALYNFFTIRQPPFTLNKVIMIEIGFRLGVYMYKRALLGKKIELCNNSGCVSLLKSKCGFLIRLRIFRFFIKIPKRIIDPNDPQRRWILWIISIIGYFGYMIRGVSLLRIRKEWILPAVTRNNTYICFLTRLLIFTAIFELESWIKRSILSVLSGW